MPRQLLSFSHARDFLLVLTTVMFIVVLDIATPRTVSGGDGADSVSVSAIAQPVGGNGDDVPLRGHHASTISFGQTKLTGATTTTGRPRQAPAPVLESPVAVERFFGDAGGRKETIILRDPHNRRSYLLETASHMHRRGWIGLESRVDPASAQTPFTRNPQ